jgi:hypothetical protein
MNATSAQIILANFNTIFITLASVQKISNNLAQFSTNLTNLGATSIVNLELEQHYQLGTELHKYTLVT